jgi:Asp-tRNA(Asn)/Glu-tRNA(Gln) amidotransferase C subunit
MQAASRASGSRSATSSSAAPATPNHAPELKSLTAPSALARTVAGQLWPDIHKQYKLGKGVFGFSCAGHGGIVAVVGSADLDPRHVEAARQRGMVELVAEVRRGSKTKRYSSSRYKRSDLEQLARAEPNAVTLTELWVGEEDCDWATILHGHQQLLEGAKQAGYLTASTTMEDVEETVQHWNERFLAALDPNYQPVSGGQIEREDEHEQLLQSGAFLRSAALGEADGRVRVTFRNKGGDQEEHWMSQETYHAIPFATDATPDDYRQHGEVWDG